MVAQTQPSLSDHDVEARIRRSLRRREGVATAGDVAADTGVPYDRADNALRRMIHLYRSHLDVDDAGNLRYRFDPELSRRGEEKGRIWRRIRAALWKAFVVLFKVWIMVTLVGYTVLFVLLLLAAAMAGIAAASRGGDNRGGGAARIGILPLYLLARVLEMLFWWNLFDSMPGGRIGRSLRRKPHKKPTKPFYQRIFQYVFGPEEEERDPLATERAFTHFVRSRDGRITAAEWASRSGQSLDAADGALTGGVVRFRGDVDVTDDGVLVYRFDELRVTAEEGGAAAAPPPPVWEQPVKVPALTGNPKSSNRWITILNGFNLVMSSVILFGVAGLSIAATVFLGIVPFVFSLIFFSVPAIRWLRLRKAEKRAALENERRQALSTVFGSAESGEASPLEEEALPAQQRDRLVLDYEGDLEVTEEGEMVYRFPTLAQQYDAARRARESAHGEELVFGSTVFSSDEEEKSLHDAEMEEFDRLLAQDLAPEVRL